MVLEMRCILKRTPIGILNFPISFSFLITLCYFSHFIYRGECVEQKCAWFEEEISNGFRDLDVF